MNPFPSTLYRQALQQRTVELVPLVEITLPPDADGTQQPTGYLSDRQITIGSTTYLRRVTKISGITQQAGTTTAGAPTSSATVVLSNVDRTMELAARDHAFYRAVVVIKAYAPYVVANSGSISDATRVVWQGYCSDVSYDTKEFTLSCKDGFFALTLPIPRRRVTRNCDLVFDDGLYCPYSGYGYKGQGAGPRVAVPDLVSITTEAAQDFGPDVNASTTLTQNVTASSSPQTVNVASSTGISAVIPVIVGTGGSVENVSIISVPSSTSIRGVFQFNHSTGDPVIGEGYNYDLATGSPGYTSCSKIFSDCKLRGMARFFGGIRYVANWATGQYGGILGNLFSNTYSSYSSSNDSIYDTAMLMVYTDPNWNYIMTPPIFQWRPEKDFLAAEAIVSLGAVGQTYDPTSLNTDLVTFVLMNGLDPHAGQFPSQPNFGVSRSGGRIGEPLVWDEIGGDLANTNTPGDPPVYMSGTAGVFIRINATDSGINNPQLGNSTNYTPQGTPTISVELVGGRSAWVYSDPATRVRQPTGNPAWVTASLALDSLDMDYAIVARHAQYLNLQSFIDLGNYCFTGIPSIVDGSTVNRYQFAGQFADLRPALDQLDASLRDAFSYRMFRNGQLTVAPFTAGQFDTISRPAFQEFINIIDGSLKVKIPQPKFNELHINYADNSFDYQQNTAVIYSESHQLFSGSNGHRSVQTQSLNFTGTCTTDQATRLGVKIVKEEIGGTTQSEWQKLREVDLQSTFLMSELEVGDVTYIAHTLIPGGGDWFRVTKWTLNEDWSMSFSLRSFRIGNYDDTVSGVSSVDPARFGYNPYIPGSGGMKYASLPALTWDTVPIASTPVVGVTLNWTPYQNPPDTSADKHNALLRSVQIFRTPSNSLAAGGFLGDDCTAAATTLVVDSTVYDYAVGQQYTMNGEIVQVTAAPGGTSLSVTRGTTATPHKKFTQIRHISYVDQVPGSSSAAGGGANISAPTSYVDPWKAGQQVLLTQAVTGSGTAQNVTVTSTAAMKLGLAILVGVDTDIEMVVPITIVDAHTVNGIFVNNHANGEIVTVN